MHVYLMQTWNNLLFKQKNLNNKLSITYILISKGVSLTSYVLYLFLFFSYNIHNI